MKLCSRILLFFCFFCFTAIIFADEIKPVEKPKWAEPLGTRLYDEADNITIIVVSGEGYDREEAKKKALDDAGRRAASITGKDCIYKDDLLTCNDITYRISADMILRESEAIQTAVINGYKRYTVYLMVVIPNDLGKKKWFKEFYSSEQYPFSSRVFVPGMAQIYKGQNLKGALFIAGEALFIGGLAVSFGVSSHYKDRHNNETNTERRNKYDDWANAAYYTGWTFVGLAAALYIANIIDGVVSPGEYATFEKGTGKKIVFAPTATFDSVGLAMNLNF